MAPLPLPLLLVPLLLLLLPIPTPAPAPAPGAAFPYRLAVVGPAEVVWNRTRDHCGGPVGAVHEEPDSLPIAWHNPRTNTSSLVSATSWGTYATVGPSLSKLQRHDCSHEVYTAPNDTRPWTYKNHQWLQSVLVWPNGSGVALVHNEFHGEQEGNLSYCSYDHKTAEGSCIFWSTDLASTTDGGVTWELVAAPLLTLPRPFIKDAAIAGYGALGQLFFNPSDGHVYSHVGFSYRNGTGAGPPNTSAAGTCAFRTRDPHSPASFRGWNGTAWATTWVNPYKAPPIPADRLWEHTCDAISLGLNHSGHATVRRFAGAWRPAGWPSHMLITWPPGGHRLAYSLPAPSATPDGPAPFTAWAAAQYLDVSDWLDPHSLRGLHFFYPTLLDHDSPFSLHPGPGPGGKPGSDSESDMAAAEALSYGLAGNASLHLYAVLNRKLIVRLPVAWLHADQPSPPGPFPPLPPVPASCSALNVTGAGLPGVSGIYTRKPSKPTNGREPGGEPLWSKDAGHQLYCLETEGTTVNGNGRSGGAGNNAASGRWTLAKHGSPPIFYLQDDMPCSGPVPAEGWWAPGGSAPFPTVACAE